MSLFWRSFQPNCERARIVFKTCFTLTAHQLQPEVHTHNNCPRQLIWLLNVESHPWQDLTHICINLSTHSPEVGSNPEGGGGGATLRSFGIMKGTPISKGKAFLKFCNSLFGRGGGVKSPTLFVMACVQKQNTKFIFAKGAPSSKLHHK